VLNSWFNLTMLAAESQHVIGLRMLKFALGGAKAQKEANLMVTEKMLAATQAATRLMMGASPDSVVKGYRRKVRANARRLLQG
jgi:hypothetical protein